MSRWRHARTAPSGGTSSSTMAPAGVQAARCDQSGAMISSISPIRGSPGSMPCCARIGIRCSPNAAKASCESHTSKTWIARRRGTRRETSGRAGWPGRWPTVARGEPRTSPRSCSSLRSRCRTPLQVSLQWVVVADAIGTDARRPVTNFSPSAPATGEHIRRALVVVVDDLAGVAQRRCADVEERHDRRAAVAPRRDGVEHGRAGERPLRSVRRLCGDGRPCPATGPLSFRAAPRSANGSSVRVVARGRPSPPGRRARRRRARSSRPSRCRARR